MGSRIESIEEKKDQNLKFELLEQYHREIRISSPNDQILLLP